MASTFFGIEIGSRSLAASQTALQVVGNNTANINTPGYSRQVVNFDETDPYTPPDSSPTKPGQLGTGVTITSINRVRDQFIDARVQASNSDQGALSNLKDILGRVEDAYNEPGDSGLGQNITNFLNTFSDLSADAQSGAIRATVRNQGETLVGNFHAVNTSLGQIVPEISQKIGVKTDDANNLAQQIAALNKQISLSAATGDHPNDLQDKRGALLDQLSSIVGIQVTYPNNASTGKPDGNISVSVGGFSLVQGGDVTPLPKTITNTNGYGLTTATGDTIPVSSGELFGLIKAQTLVGSYQTDLNTLAAGVINAVNTLHSAGYGLDGNTGRNFFTGTDASNIALSSQIKASTDAIAASTAPQSGQPFAPGNGDNARALAALTSQPSIGSFSLNGYYNAKVALIGADSHTFQTQADNQDKVANLLKNQQQSISGVNLDEELTKLLQYQRTYQAAARFISTSDAFLDRIINGLGAANAA